MTIRNPENPFVKNEFYFYGSLPYNQTNLYIFHKANNIIAFVVGIFLALLLLFLVVFKTPPSFRPYSKMVFLCVLTDLIILVSDFLCQTRLKVSNGLLLLSFTGPFAQLSYKGQCNVMIIQTFGGTIAAAVLPLQYFYRYTTLKKRKSPTNFQTFLFYCVPTAFTSVISIMSGMTYNVGPGELPNYDYGTLWYEENQIPHLIIGSPKSTWMLIEIIYLVLFLIGSYGLTIWLAKQTIKELDSRAFELTERTKSLQQQFSRTLLVQALTPLCTSVVPLAAVIVGIISGSSTGYAGEFIILGMTWFPVLNSLSNIIFIVPYRRYCLRLVPGYEKRTNSSFVQPSTVFAD